MSLFRGSFALAAALALTAPAALPAPAAAARLDVMSYNINWGAPSGKRLEAIARVIASSGADVAGLQQVRRFARQAKKGSYGCVDQPARLAKSLTRLTGKTWYWAYAANTSKRQSARQCRNVTSTPRQEGVAILSRYPITSAMSYRLPHARGVARVKVSVPGEGAVTIYTVHLDSFSEGRRKAQARQVAALVGRGGGSTVFLTGDMNSRPNSAVVRMLREVGRDTWADKGHGRGATKRGRIDYVFYRGDARPESVRVIQSWASDHRPVIARFSLD